MLVTESRPRNLQWIHAGPLLYGDWGTSRLYVLGLAFLYTGHASILYLASIGLLMIAVSWAYTIVCRAFPDGGGVYTAARQLSPTLSVIGATLLLSGYIMTAAISVIEAFHYFGVDHHLVVPLSIVSIVLIGAVNWLGAKSAGRFALVVAFAALGVSAVMAVISIPHFIAGARTISLNYLWETPISQGWVNFTKICLALAGVEAVANMTGLMRQPVDREAKRTIWPVAAEVVGLNLWFGLALAGLGFIVAGTPLREMHTPDDVRIVESRQAFIDALPAHFQHDFRAENAIILTDQELGLINDPAAAERYQFLREHETAVNQYTNASMRVIAREAATDAFGPKIGAVFGQVAGITFGLLLLSATNTAVMAMVSVLYSMAQDRELPRGLTKLNYSGVPWVGLIVSMVIPAAVILVEDDVTVLASLYVLGVCGAITVTVLSTAWNRALEIKGWQRVLLWGIGLFLLSITVTIAITQTISTVFSGTLIALVLGFRILMQRKAAPKPVDAPTTGWMAILNSFEMTMDPDKPKIMLAARGRYQAEYAIDLAKRRGATLMAIYVRPIRVLDPGPGKLPGIDTDESAQEALGSAGLLAREAGVPFMPIYVTSTTIADEILDYTVTYGCDTLIMGKSNRSVFSRKLEGDVVAQVQAALPEGVTLITRSAEMPHAVVPTGSDRGIDGDQA